LDQPERKNDFMGNCKDSESIGGISNQREYSRVDAYIPLNIRVVTDDEKYCAKSRISEEVILADFKLMPSLDNYPQLEHLNDLNKKIDSIIQMVTFPQDGFYSLSFKCVSISGNGMKFSFKNNLSLGDILELKMILRTYKPIALYVYGKVVHVEKQTDGYCVSVQFIRIDDHIRDLIVRFVFQMERAILREQHR